MRVLFDQGTPVPLGILARSPARGHGTRDVGHVAQVDSESLRAARSGSVRLRWMDDQLERATIAQADCREVAHVARGQTTDAESLGERDDRSPRPRSEYRRSISIARESSSSAGGANVTAPH